MSSGRMHARSVRYGPKASRYVAQQRRHFARIGHPLVGQHGEDVAAVAAEHNVVTLDSLEQEKRADAHNCILMQLALYHTFIRAGYLPSNLPPLDEWVKDEYRAFCALRALDTKEGASLKDYHKGPLGQKIRGYPPLALLIRMVDLTTFPGPELITQMPTRQTKYFPYYEDWNAVNTIVARKALELYAPIAELLGYGGLCRALKSMAVQYLYPKRTRDVGIQMAELASPKQESDKLLAKVVALLKERFEGSLTAILREDKGKGSSVIKLEANPEKYGGVEDFSDLSAAFILVDSISDIYDVVELLTGPDGAISNVMRRSAPKCTFHLESDDYIATPKPGSLDRYQSYHVDVKVDRRKTGRTHTNFELIVRTREMHEACEQGIAAHWLYKGNRENPDEQRRVIRAYDDLLLAAAAGSVADLSIQRSIAMSLLDHEKGAYVTVRCMEGRQETVKQVEIKTGYSVPDALVAAGVDITKPLHVQGRNIVGPITGDDLIEVRVGGGGRRLSRSLIRALLPNVRTQEAAAILGAMLKR